jgi:predicted amidohydrolase
MQIGIAQLDPVWEDKTESMQRATRALDALGEVDLIVLPEMSLTGFTMNPDAHAEEIDGESVRFFADRAKAANARLIGGAAIKDGDKFYNEAILFGCDGAVEARYKKTHPFGYGDEDKHYAAGERPVGAAIDEWAAGLAVCYDLRFPELFRFYGKERRELIVVIANWPSPRIEHWRTLLKARAIENQCVVVGVNRVGEDPKASYPGRSAVFGPMGEPLLDMNDEPTGAVEIDVDHVRETRERFGFLNDIRMI